MAGSNFKGTFAASPTTGIVTVTDAYPAGTYTVTNSAVDVAFTDANGVLKLDDIVGFAGTLITYGKGDAFVITGGTLSGLGVSNGNTLTFADSGVGAGPGGIGRNAPSPFRFGRFAC